MALPFPLEIQDLIIDEIAASKDQKTLRSCQLVSHTFRFRSLHHLFASITINRVQSPDIGERLVLLKDIMLGTSSLPGITTHIQKFTINARDPPCKKHTAHPELTEAFFGKFELCVILRLLSAQENTHLHHLCLMFTHGFAWTSLHCVFEHTFSSLLSRSPSIRHMTLEGLSGIPSTVILGKKIQKLFLLQSFIKEDPDASARAACGVNDAPLLSASVPAPPPLEYLHIHDRFPAYILSRSPGCVAPKMNIADLSVSIRTPDGFSTIDNIGKLGSGSIGDVKRLMLRFNAQAPAFPTDAFNWWLHFPKLHSIALHYRNARTSSSTDELVKNARAILVPPTTTITTTALTRRGAATTTINIVSFEFDFKMTPHPFGPSTADRDYTTLIDESRWKKWSWLDEVLSHPFYASVTTLRVGIRVYPYPSPPTRGAETMAKLDVKEFTASVARVFREMLSLFSERRKVDVQCCLAPISF